VTGEVRIDKDIKVSLFINDQEEISSVSTGTFKGAAHDF